MPRIDFYVLPAATDWQRFLCQLTGKVWKSGNTVHIHTDSETQADRLDDLLWTFHDVSFLPHEKMHGSEKKPDSPITIGWHAVTPDSPTVLINLSEDVPEFADQFERIVEIAGGDESQKHMARRRYKHYRAQKYALHDHKIDSV